MSEIVSNLISTIIPVHNRPEMVKSAVESALQQNYRPIEIIIVDDGSTDDTLAVCASLSRQHPDIIRLLQQPNLGPGPAREKGRLAARGEFIQYLDSDDLLIPEKFSTQVSALRENPDCEIAYGITRLVDFQGNCLAEPFKLTGENHSHLFPGLLVDRWWCTHTPLYRRSLCDRIGPWSDLRYSQDWEYDARAGALGARLVTTNTMVSEHRTHDEARQTGHGGWLEPADQVKFFYSLYEAARAAGIEHSTPEMQHFSRWVFARARACGAAGDPVAAKALYSLARSAAFKPDRSMLIIGLLAKLFGWKVTGSASAIRDRFSSNSSGPMTRKLSWMVSEDGKTT